MKLFLDDMRPAPAGWTLVTTVAEAKAFLKTGDVEEASLDRDLYEWCPSADGAKVLPARPQPESGEDLVRWMIDTGHWPHTKPRVHSQSERAGIMERAIEKHWRRKP